MKKVLFPILGLVLALSLGLVPAMPATSATGVIWTIGTFDNSRGEFNHTDFNGVHEATYDVATHTASNFPAFLYISGYSGSWQVAGVHKVTINFSLTTDYRDATLKYKKAGGETNEVSLDGGTPQTVSGPGENIFDTYELSLGDLSSGTHHIVIECVDKGTGEGAHTYDALELSALASPTCVPPPSGMVSWWPGDGDASDIADGNDGTLQNGATFAAGKVGQAFSLDGTDDYVDFGSVTGLPLTNTGYHTVDLWVKGNASSSTYEMPISLGNKTLIIGTYMDKIACTRLVNSASYSSISSGTYDWSMWHHLVFVFDGSKLYDKIYVDGVNVTTAWGAHWGQSATDKVVLGYDIAYPSGWGGYSLRWNGLIDEVEIFDRALSADEIQAIYNAGSAGKCKVAPLDHFLGYKVKTTKVCDGGVTELTLLNNGPKGDITVTAKDGVVFGPEEVLEGHSFSFGTEGVKLGTSITITVAGVSETTIHTSCSQPIYSGLTFGVFEVVEGQSLKGGPLETPAPKFEPVVVELADQFVTGVFQVEKPDKFYNPADKEIVPDEADFDDVADVETHLMSYKIKLVEYLEPPTCVPCKGGLTSLTLQYNGSSAALVVVTGGSEPFEETLNEGEEFTIVGGGKDGKLDKDVTITVDSVLEATIHTSCSQPIGTGQTFGVFTVVAGESKDGGPICPIITVESQFGTIVVARDKPDRLLVPTAKSLTGPVDELDETGVDHFLGYKIKAPKDMPELFQVTVVDQFDQPKLYDVKKPTMLFVPVDKNGEGIKNPEAHLISYKIKLVKDQPKHINVLGIYTKNQFGPLKLNTDKEVELLVPCTKKILP